MVMEPPAIYSHPYAPLTEWIEAAPEVDRLCRSAGAQGNEQIVGCSFKLGAHCYIIISKHAVEVLRRHETAHCNGWKH